MSNWFQFCLKLKLGRWAVEFSRDDGFIGLWLALLRYSKDGGSAYPRWQWRPGFRWPVIMKQEQMPVFECAGIRIVPCEVIKEELWPEVVDG